MSHALMRGVASRAQLYLDGVLNSVQKTKGVEDPRRICISELLWHCMNENRSGMFMINGSTGESFTNEEILKMSVPLARALLNKGLCGKIVMVALKNHQCMAAIYCGVLFAGAIPFLIDSNNTKYEYMHFLELVKPNVIFCEEDFSDDILEVVNSCTGERPDIVVADSYSHLQLFMDDFSDDLETFRVTDVDVNLPAVILPTSGSTGLPKAALLSHKGLMAQIPTIWTDHDQFPRPTDLVMLVSTAQWMTHTAVLISSAVYQIPLLMTPTSSVSGLLTMIRKHRPTWTLLGPEFAIKLANSASSDDLTSFQTVLTTGSQPRLEAMKILKEKLPKNIHLCNGYGMTETHGFTTMPHLNSPYQSVGRIANIFDYKLVDDDGNKVGMSEKGELFVRSKLCILQGYYRNEEANADSITKDGWLKTGDVFYEDSNGLLYFVERKKFGFKYLNYQISPEELEAVISSLPGVEECVVSESCNGAAAAVVPRPGFCLAEADIHQVINATLSEHKYLRGGVMLVEKLPRTHSGKLHRTQCRHLLNKLIAQRTKKDL